MSSKLYRIGLSDKSFLIVDGDYPLRIFKYRLISKHIATCDYVKYRRRYQGWYMLDLIDGKKIRRQIVSAARVHERWRKYLGMRLKYAPDIQIGDLIEGDNHTPREVDELHRGHAQMYEISDSDGNVHIVNGGHILYLYDTHAKTRVSIPVSMYLELEDKDSLRIMQVES